MALWLHALAHNAHSAPTALHCGHPHEQNDVWALAVMALEALTGTHPFSPEGPCGGTFGGNVLYSIAHHSRVKLPSYLSPECADFLGRALQVSIPSCFLSPAFRVLHVRLGACGWGVRAGGGLKDGITKGRTGAALSLCQAPSHVLPS